MRGSTELTYSVHESISHVGGTGNSILTVLKVHTEMRKTEAQANKYSWNGMNGLSVI